MAGEMIHLRLNKPEKERLQKTAEELGITLNELIRRTSFIFSRLDSVFWDSLRYLSESSFLMDDKILELIVYIFQAKIIARTNLGQDWKELDELKSCYYITGTAKGGKHPIDVLVKKYTKEFQDSK